MSHLCICRRLVSKAFQLRSWKQSKVTQGRAWETKSFDLEIGTKSCDAGSTTLRRPIPMPRSCCSRPGTCSRESYLSLPDTASTPQTEPPKVERSGSTLCTQHLAFITFLRVKLHNSWPPNPPSRNWLDLQLRHLPSYINLQLS
jgi:hypothetical protein